uniref:NADH-ubiquinone oxidoreductase chain 1 n=1 Tax=Chelydra serpentina TaxID=8475 RepID=A0A8C3TE00_CHESE
CSTINISPLLYIISILIAVAFFTLIERKTLGYIQLRKGPNIVGPYGLLQPVADGVKLFIKEPIYPSNSSIVLFTLSPILALLLALSVTFNRVFMNSSLLPTIPI